MTHEAARLTAPAASAEASRGAARFLLSDLTRHPRAHSLELEPLSRAEVEELVGRSESPGAGSPRINARSVWNHRGGIA